MAIKKTTKPKSKSTTVAALTKSTASADKKNERIATRWRERIQVAQRIKQSWVRRFQCDQGWKWYEGYQGADAHLFGDADRDRYIINLIYPTVEVKIPSLYFHNPKATVVPRPAKEDDPMSTLEERAQLREDTVNTFMSDPGFHLKEHTDLALKDSFFYFGIVEVGYSADYVRNPRAGRPVLDDDGNSMSDDETGEPILEPSHTPTDESVYVKRISPKQFIVSPRASFILEDADWCGYYEWVYSRDLKRDPMIENRDKIEASGSFHDDYTGKISLNDSTPDSFFESEEVNSKIGMSKVWFIWDLRRKERFMLPDGGKYFLQSPKPYKVFPFPTIKFHEREEGWYPMPPHFNWMSPQAELNDTRQMQRMHRKRMIRRYQMYKNTLDKEEAEKMESGGDGTVVQTNLPVPAIMPIEDAPLDFAIARNVPATKEDFADITAAGSDQRQGGGVQPETATEASVMETRARIRESFGQEQISKWISNIGRTILMTIEEHMALPFWIKRNVDPGTPDAPVKAMEVAHTYQQIQVSEMGNLNYDVSVSAESLSPVNADLERAQFNEMMQALVSSPLLLLMFRASDALLRRFLRLNGMRNEKMVQQVKLAIEVALLAQIGPAVEQLPQDPGKSGQEASTMSNMMMGAATPPPTNGAGASGAGATGGANAATGSPLPGLSAALAQLRGQMGMPG